MGLNKIMSKNGDVIFDLTNDTITPKDVVAGVYFHDRRGEMQTGTLVIDKEDKTKIVKFIDYDNTIVAEYSLEEVKQLQSLPQAPNHDADNLTFQKWNYDLDYVKNTTGELFIGATYHTTDNCSYFPIRLVADNVKITLSLNISDIKIDWGDGTITESGLSHTYNSKGDYTIKVDSNNVGYKIISYIIGSDTLNSNIVGVVKLSNSVTSIGNSAFYNCYSLQNVVIPNSVTSISNSTFYNCYSLQNVVIPNSVTSISNSTFYNCYSLQNVVIPNSVTSIGDKIFGNCYSLQNVVIPNSVTSIGDEIFYNCHSLQNVVIPNSVTSISNSAFINCYSLQNVVIPNSVTSIGDEIFYNCHSLQNVVIPNSVTSIGNSTFYNCYSLQNVVIPNSVTSIGNSAFINCHSLRLIDLSTFEKPITIPSTSSIGYSQGLRTIYLVAKGTLELYRNATNWSTIYAKGLIRESEE